jgi:hypothetical protein
MQAMRDWSRAHPAPPLFDLSIPTPDMSHHARDAIDATVGVMVDQNGQKKGCGALPSRRTAALAEAACQAALGGWKSLPAAAPQGTQVETIQTVVVRFMPTAR